MGKYAAVVTLDDEDDEFIVNVSKENHAFSSKVISAKGLKPSPLSCWAETLCPSPQLSLSIPSPTPSRPSGSQ